MATTNSELKDAVSDAVNQAVTSGISGWREGNQEFRRWDPNTLLDALERLENRAAEDAGARVFKPLVEFDH